VISFFYIPLLNVLIMGDFQYYHSDIREQTVLHQACKYGTLLESSFIIIYPYLYDKGHNAVASWAISCGSDLNARNCIGDTPLIIASSTGNLSLVQLVSFFITSLHTTYVDIDM
jgi:ankyrin repeat protein